MATNRKAADAFADNVLPMVRQIQAAGATTFRAITAATGRGSFVPVFSASRQSTNLRTYAPEAGGAGTKQVYHSERSAGAGGTDDAGADGTLQ